MGVLCLSVTLASLFCYGCASTHQGGGVPRELVGTLVRVGAEPFTRLGLQVSEGRIYILQGEREILALLGEHQGRRAKVQVRGTEFASEGVVLLIGSAEILELSPTD